MSRHTHAMSTPPGIHISPAGFDHLLRRDLGFFIDRTFRHLNPNTPYLPNWHLDLIADRLMRVASGELRRLIITVPPRSMKSLCASIAFVAWVLGNMPHRRIICVSYGQELANKHARDTLGLMQSKWYQRAFPQSAPVRIAAADFETASQGGRMATSVGGVLTGRGGDILIIDDPTKPDDMLSETMRASANTWYDHSLLSRLNDQRTGAIVLIMQRQHVDDMVGHVQGKGEQWETVNLPAIAAEPEVWQYRTLKGPQSMMRAEGDVLHESREPREVLERMRREMGSYVFEAQYLQAPTPHGGAMVKDHWLHRYSAKDLPEKYDAVVQSWDTANKESELSGYSVCTTWGYKDKRGYLLHVLRKRLSYPDLKREVMEQQQIWSATKILIEDRASGIQLIQELKHERLWQIEAVNPVGDKVMRMQAQTAAIENGLVRFPKEEPWLDIYFNELLSFPGSKYKDQVDSTSQALAWMAERSRGSCGFEFKSAGQRVGYSHDMDQFIGEMP